MEGISSRDAEFVCRRCGKVVSFEIYKLSQYCPNPNCGTLLQLRPRPKHWLFQFNPATYRWLDRVGETKEPEQWLTSQHFKHIHEGDLVAIWASGEKGGIYAIGHIMTKPAKKPLNAEQEKYFIEKDYIGKFQEKPSVNVGYSKVALDKPLLQDECNRDATLSGMQIFKNPHGTNFRLTTDEWTRILELMEQTK